MNAADLERLENGTGEGAVAELSDGRVYDNSRSHAAADALRRTAWNHDGGQTWRDLAVCQALPDGPRGTAYGCMGGLTRLPVKGTDILVYSNLDEPTTSRRRITAWASLDGELAWVYPTALPLGHSPAVHEGVAYVGGFDRRLHALDAKTGRRLWTCDSAEAGYRTSPLVTNGKVFLGNRDALYRTRLTATVTQSTVNRELQRCQTCPPRGRGRVHSFSKEAITHLHF